MKASEVKNPALRGLLQDAEARGLAIIKEAKGRRGYMAETILIVGLADIIREMNEVKLDPIKTALQVKLMKQDVHRAFVFGEDKP